MPKVGRPKAQPKQHSTEDVIRMLARAQCSNIEIAAHLRISPATLKANFQPVLKEGRKQGLSNLRAKQYEVAMKGNVTMLIWLGKQVLGQRDGMLLNRDPNLPAAFQQNNLHIQNAQELVDLMIKLRNEPAEAECKLIPTSLPLSQDHSPLLPLPQSDTVS